MWRFSSTAPSGSCSAASRAEPCHLRRARDLGVHEQLFASPPRVPRLQRPGAQPPRDVAGRVRGPVVPALPADRADPGVDKTPLYGMKKDKSGNVVSRGNANTGKYKGADPWMRDTPGVLDPTAMQFVATAMDVSAGTSFGAVLWGFEYDSSKSHYKEQTPELISKGDPMLKGRNEAIEKWNKAVATPGSGIDQAPEINEKLPFPVGDFPEPTGDTRLA